MDRGNSYKAIVYLLVNGAIRGEEADLFIKMIDKGFNIGYELEPTNRKDALCVIKFERQTHIEIKDKMI